MELGDTRGCTQAGWHRSFPLQAPGGSPGTGRGRTLPGTAAARCLGMEPGPARVPARGHRALGAHLGQGPAPDPAHPAPGAARCVTAGKGRGGQGRDQPGSGSGSGKVRSASRCPETPCPGTGPLDVTLVPCVPRAVPCRGHRAGGAHACTPGANSNVRAHRHAGPRRLRPRAISQLLAGHSAPAAPPRPALTFAQIPQGARGEGIKREPRAAPASQSPAQVSGDIPGEGRAGKGTGSGAPCPPCCPTSCALLSPQP